MAEWNLYGKMKPTIEDDSKPAVASGCSTLCELCDWEGLGFLAGTSGRTVVCQCRKCGDQKRVDWDKYDSPPASISDGKFIEWLKQLDEAAFRNGHAGSVTTQTGPETWRENFQNGDDPEDAYLTDMMDA